MPLSLHTIKPFRKSRKKSKRLGRGFSSKGKYSGRGQKGQRSRSGGKSGLKAKGMRQTLLSIPKVRGFKSPHPKMDVVNVGALDKKFKDGDKVTAKLLKQLGLVSKIKNGIKILGNGELSKKLIIEGMSLSSRAKEKVEQSGGKIVK